MFLGLSILSISTAFLAENLTLRPSSNYGRLGLPSPIFLWISIWCLESYDWIVFTSEPRKEMWMFPVEYTPLVFPGINKCLVLIVGFDYCIPIINSFQIQKKNCQTPFNIFPTFPSTSCAFSVLIFSLETLSFQPLSPAPSGVPQAWGTAEPGIALCLHSGKSLQHPHGLGLLFPGSCAFSVYSHLGDKLL